jgi:hypothetical protein
MIPLRFQLYAAVAVAFFLGVLGIRSKWISDGEDRVRMKMADKKIKAIKEAQDVRNEVEAFDRDTLRGRATVWVRGNKPKR